MYAVSEADWGRENLKAFAFLVNTGKDGTFSLPQSLRDSSLIRGSLVRSQQPSERKQSFAGFLGKADSFAKSTKSLLFFGDAGAAICMNLQFLKIFSKKRNQIQILSR